MKVLITADAVGGVWTHTVDLASSLLRLGVTTEVASMGPLPSSHQRKRLSDAGIALHQSTFALEWMDDPWHDIERAGRWLLALAEESGADLVHLNGYAHAALPWPVPVVVGAHSCVATWWEAVKHESLPPAWGRYRAAVGAGLGAAGALAAPTHAMVAGLERNYPRLPRLRKVIPNGRALRLPAVTKRVLVASAGRLWDEGKNLACLDRAASSIRWPVVVAGDTINPAGARVTAAHVRLAGALGEPAIAALFGAAPIFALPAKYEPFGLAALEAAMAGCALVLGDIDSQREVWGEAALYVPPDDHDALAMVVNDLIERRRRRQEMGLAARRRAARYSVDAMACGYRALYNEVVHAEATPCAS